MKERTSDGLWLGVELRHLAVLDALAKDGSFRGAANRLGYVQSAVSQKIAQVEQATGVQLVERNRGQRGVRLTRAGEILAEQASAILLQIGAAQGDLATLDDPARALRVAFAPSLGAALVERMLGALGPGNSTSSVETVDPGDESRLEDVVELGDADLAVGELGDRDRFRCRPLFEDRYRLLVPAESRLASTRTASLEDLGQLNLLSPLASQGMPHGERHLRAHGVEPTLTARTVSAATLQGLVRDRVGAAVLPELAIDRAERGVAVISLGDLLPPRPIAAYWQSQRRRTDAIVRACEAIELAVGGQR